MQGKAHPPEKNAQVLAALLSGQGVTEVARQYKIPHSTVSRLKRQIADRLDELGQEKKRDFGELLGSYLEENITTLIAQAKVFRDPTYLKRQSAAENATLHGVMADKGIRLLEAAALTAQSSEG